MDCIGTSTVGTLLDERADLGDDLFLIYEGTDGNAETYTYAEFVDFVDRTATVLHDTLGIGRGDHVAVHLSNGPEYLAVWFGLLKLGAVVVHSNINNTPRENEHEFSQSESELVITEPSLVENVTASTADTPVERITVFDRSSEVSATDHDSLGPLVDEAEIDVPDIDLDAGDPAQMIFTSGTTSEPKAVVQTHANLLYSGERISKHVGVRPSDRLCCGLPLFHVSAQWSTMLPTLTVGATAVVLEEFETEDYVDQLRRHSATVTFIIATQARAMLAKPRTDVDGDNDLREVILAVNVTDEEKRRFEERFDTSVLNAYGLSEAVTLVSMAPLYGNRRWPSIGRPMVDRDVYVVDDEGTDLGVGEVGEIAVRGTRGRNLFDRYYGMPEKTEEAFTDDGLFLTGDMGRLDEDGFLYHVDRKKNIVKTKGENVSESEVESILEEHPDVRDVAVVGIHHEVYGEVVKAYVKPDDGDVSRESVLEHAEARLAEFKLPRELEFVEEFPRTSIGKIEKKVLRKGAESASE